MDVSCPPVSKLVEVPPRNFLWLLLERLFRLSVPMSNTMVLPVKLDCAATASFVIFDNGFGALDCEAGFTPRPCILFGFVRC